MTISWYGQSFFEIAVKGIDSDVVKIAIDPFSPEIGLKLPKVEANILLVSHQHSDHNNIEAIKPVKVVQTGKEKPVLKGPFLIEGPGEYELQGVFIRGISAFHDDKEGKERGEVTLYKIEAEDISLCHLSDFGQKELSEAQLEQIGEVDILMIPVASEYSLEAKGASAVIAQVEPRLVIPMHYKLPNLKLKMQPLEAFLKLMGEEGLKPEKKLKVKARDLPQEETKIVLLEP